MKEIYSDGTYLMNNPDWHEEDAPFKSDKILNLLSRHKLSADSIAEIGCGSGEILVLLQKKLENVSRFVGFDISPAAIAIAKKKENPKIQFQNIDLAVSNSDEFFDVLLVIDVIEHVENYFQFLKGISSKSKFTIFHIPLDMSIRTILQEKILIESKGRVGHIHNFTEDFIISILADLGFETIDKVYTEPLYHAKSLRQKAFKLLQMLCFKISPRLCSKTFGGCSLLLLTRNFPT